MRKHLIISWSGNCHEDEQEALMMLKAKDWQLAIWDLDQFLRNEIKHGNDDTKQDHYQEIRDKLYESLSEYDLQLD